MDIETRYWGRLSDEQLPIEARSVADDLPENTRDLVLALVDRIEDDAEDIRRAERDAAEWEGTAQDSTSELEDANETIRELVERLDKLQKDLDDALSGVTQEE